MVSFTGVTPNGFGDENFGEERRRGYMKLSFGFGQGVV